jgi:hypothetical protein
MGIACYVDADYASLKGFEDPYDLASMKSRTGFVFCLLLGVILFGQVSSKLTLPSQQWKPSTMRCL